MREAGVINIYKEKGYTSHDVVAIVRKALNRVKTGHTGTLDPQAEGVLPICIGRATRLAAFITADRKTYHAEVVLGVTTDTGDQTGQVTAVKPVVFDRLAITQAAQSFQGTYDQTPPMYAAIKVNGQKLYNLARKGVSVERQARAVHIEALAVTAFYPERHAFDITVTCSKGTYIRSLCADIGDKLGCGASMGALLRTRSGVFDIADAVRLDTLTRAAAAGCVDDFIWPVERVLPYPHAQLRAEGEKRALNGNPLPLSLIQSPASLPAEGMVWLYHQAQLVGLYSVQDKDTPDGRLQLEVLFV